MQQENTKVTESTGVHTAGTTFIQSRENEWKDIIKMSGSIQAMENNVRREIIDLIQSEYQFNEFTREERNIIVDLRSRVIKHFHGGPELATKLFSLIIK